MLERKLYPPENDRQIEPWKMTENLNLENARMEIAHPGKYQKWKMHNLEIPEPKLHILENDKKITPRKMTKNQQLKFARMENTQP